MEIVLSYYTSMISLFPMAEKDALLSVFLEFFKKHENKRRRIHILRNLFKARAYILALLF